MERKIFDSFGFELNKGDYVCFVNSINLDDKPIVKAKIYDFEYAKRVNYDGTFSDWIVPEYVENADVERGRRHNKLPKKVLANRVVKCY